MRRTLTVIAFACLSFVGLSGTALAGNGWPGAIDCGFSGSMCEGIYLWDVDYKCEGDWEDDGTYVSVGDEEAELRAEGGANGWADCEIDIDLESDDDVGRYEAKCEANCVAGDERGNSGKYKLDCEKVELEIKVAYDLAECD